MSFEDARVFVRDLQFTERAQWTKYARSGEKPEEIPTRPDYVYRDAGWVGWGDWLGVGYSPEKRSRYLKFALAREFVRRLGLGSYSDWQRYARSADRPDWIPAYPAGIYKERGWAGWNDWLGTVSRRRPNCRG